MSIACCTNSISQFQPQKLMTFISVFLTCFGKIYHGVGKKRDTFCSLEWNPLSAPLKNGGKINNKKKNHCIIFFQKINCCNWHTIKKTAHSSKWNKGRKVTDNRVNTICSLPKFKWRTSFVKLKVLKSYTQLVWREEADNDHSYVLQVRITACLRDKKNTRCTFKENWRINFS